MFETLSLGRKRAILHVSLLNLLEFYPNSITNDYKDIGNADYLDFLRISVKYPIRVPIITPKTVDTDQTK